MRSISKSFILERLSFISEKAEFTLERTSCIEGVNDFLLTPSGVDLFDATTMRLQVIGEMIKQIDVATKGLLLKQYPEIPWRSVFGLRNLISHEYASVDPNEILNIVKHNLSPLLAVLHRIADDLNAGKHDAIFQEKV